MLIDTDLERKINLGKKYPYDEIDDGYCIISEQFAKSLDVEIDDIIYLQIDMFQNLIALINAYNFEVAEQQNLPKIRTNVVRIGSPDAISKIACRV